MNPGSDESLCSQPAKLGAIFGRHQHGDSRFFCGVALLTSDADVAAAVSPAVPRCLVWETAAPAFSGGKLRSKYSSPETLSRSQRCQFSGIGTDET